MSFDLERAGGPEAVVADLPNNQLHAADVAAFNLPGTAPLGSAPVGAVGSELAAAELAVQGPGQSNPKLAFVMWRDFGIGLLLALLLSMPIFMF